MPLGPGLRILREMHSEGAEAEGKQPQAPHPSEGPREAPPTYREPRPWSHRQESPGAF